ncbi:ribonuclease E inhibitor RraB [Longivirga aurantiaca]|uniref:Ribonuclease E inhibitor RraB n=1 Tax=Longivirga aurantiaca TaxID=1837743 RepID=A0ABW1T3S0_9ACTN
MGLLDRLKRSRNDEVDPDERSPQLGIKYKDLMVVEQMVKAGADLSEPRHWIYYLYLPTEALAEEAAVEARAAGWGTVVRPSADEASTQWCVVAEQHDVVLTPALLTDADNLFQGIADRLDGDYDGWEASV